MRWIVLFSGCLIALAVLLRPVDGFATVSETELVIALEMEPPHFNPACLSGNAVGSVGAQLFAGLTRLSASGEPLPYLATGWTHSADFRRFEFHLRGQAVFHDGVPITSKDVAFSLRASQRNHPFKPMLEAVERIETPDPHTVIVHLSHPFPMLPSVLVPALVPILPRHVFDTGEPLPTHPANLSPTGSGSFMLDVYTPGHSIRLKKHPRFFSGQTAA